MELDTEKSYARYALHSPKKIDFTAIQKAAHGAGYTIKKLEIELAGEVTKAPCKECEKDALFFKVERTGQLLEIDGEVAVGSRGRLRASASDWGKDVLGFFSAKEHVVLRVDSIQP